MDFLAVLFILISFVEPTFCAIYSPSPIISALEHILVDTVGAFRSGFKDAITPCTNYIQGPQTTGRESAAQWVRVIFHDFVTARVALGIGGVDASIGFETLRDENSGTAFNDSFSFWRTWVNDRVSSMNLSTSRLSYADMIKWPIWSRWVRRSQSEIVEDLKFPTEVDGLMPQAQGQPEYLLQTLICRPPSSSSRTRGSIRSTQ